MAEESYREIYLFKKWRVPPIDIVYGSALPITLKFLDYTIPANATIMVYASVNETTVYQQTATANGNAVQFTPGYGFFAVGLNKLQIAINGNKITLEILVNCQRFLAEGNDPTSTPEAVRPMVEEAREILKETKAVAVKTPYVGENGNWYVWDTATGEFKDSGKPSKGDKGDAFTYSDFTAEQLAGLKGPKGDAFTYDDFTPEQLAGLKGPKGDAFEYSDFTPAQLAALKGDPGTPATVTATETVYQAGTSGTEAPTGTWSETVPTVPQGQYLWTRVTTSFNTGSPVVYYSVSRFGVDGSGSVVSVNGVGPDNAGNIQLTGDDIMADDETVSDKLTSLQGQMGTLQTNFNSLSDNVVSTLNTTQAKITATGVLKGTGTNVEAAQAGVDYQAPLTGSKGKYVGFTADNTPGAVDLPSASADTKGITYLVDSYTSTDTDKAATPKAVNDVYKLLPVSTSVTLTAAGWSSGTQTVSVAGVTADNHVIVAPAPASRDPYINSDVRCTAQGAGTLTFTAASTPTVNITVNIIILKQ